MKNLLKISLMCLILAVGCMEKNGPDLNGSGGYDGVYTVTLPSSTTNGKTAWQSGDKLVVHGESSKDQITLTLAPDDISADGRTCSINVTGVAPYVQKATNSVYYIAYPGDFVENESKCKDKSKFKESNAFLLAGYNVDKNFVVESLVGGLAFTVSGEYDSYEFKGNNSESVGYSTLTCRITTSLKSYLNDKGDALPLISGGVISDGKSMNHICIPGDLDLTDGFMLTLYKGSVPVKTLYTETPYSLKRDEFISLGDISLKLVDYKAPAAETHISAIPTENAVNLGAEETANCYIVTEPGIYAFKAVQGNSADPIASIGSVEVLWETWGTTEEVDPASVVAEVDFEKNMVYFRIEEDFHPGNAVIAARNDMGAIIWSWHIWVPETPVEEGLYGLSRRMTMDRNLGALTVASADGASAKSSGLFYQWGRKDPFVGVGDFSTGSPAYVAGQSMTLSGGQMSTSKSIKNPTEYADYDGHWNPSPSVEYWAQKKTKYDPCPSGYKVPYRSEYLPFTSAVMELPCWMYDKDGGVLAMGNPATTYPLGGYMTTSGEYAQYGEGTRVWSSRTHSTASEAYNFRVFESDGLPSYGNGSKPKSNGYAVRCVRHDAVPFENEPGTPVKGNYTKYRVNLTELSGLCLHIDGTFLWGVGDQGQLAKIGFDGSVEKVFGQALDMEAVTIDPETGNLYLGCESNWVGVVKAPDYKRAEEVFRVADAANYGNSGVEGISWYKDGMLLVGAQTDARLWAYKLDGTVVWSKSLKTVAIGCLEIADICYDPVKDQIWIIDSETQSIYLFNGDATKHLATYKVNFAGNSESLYVDYERSCVWVADDSDASALFKVDFTF